jgi:hypothetical protein
MADVEEQEGLHTSPLLRINLPFVFDFAHRINGTSLEQLRRRVTLGRKMIQTRSAWPMTR